MDSHDVSRGRGSFEDVLGGVHTPVKVVGIDSDHLYPAHEQKELAKLLRNAEYKEIKSSYGHDAFLIEFEQINDIINPFIKEKQTLSY
jgi:homoserine O-acetyltransferase